MKITVDPEDRRFQDAIMRISQPSPLPMTQRISGSRFNHRLKFVFLDNPEQVVLLRTNIEHTEGAKGNEERFVGAGFFDLSKKYAEWGSMTCSERFGRFMPDEQDKAEELLTKIRESLVVWLSQMTSSNGSV